MSMNFPRRKILKTLSISLALIPLVALIRPAKANTNEMMRSKLKYQNTPMDNLSCTSCLEFVPGTNEKEKGGCKIIPGDDEISPNGYCSGYNTL